MLDDAKADVPPPDMVTDGGADPVARAATYCELALVLAAGLDDERGMATLLKARVRVRVCVRGGGRWALDGGRGCAAVASACEVCAQLY